MQETQLAANVMQADLQQRIVAALELLVGLPVHSFGFAAITIQDVSLPTQRLWIVSARPAVQDMLRPTHKVLGAVNET